MISPALARSVVTIAHTCMCCLLVVMVLGHYLLSPAATAMLGCAIGARLGAARCLRQITWRGQ